MTLNAKSDKINTIIYCFKAKKDQHKMKITISYKSCAKLPTSMREKIQIRQCL